MFKERSKLLMTVVILESILSVWVLFYFNYLDRLNYAESIVISPTNLALMIEDMYTSSWWALIILSVCLANIFSAVCLIYRSLKFQFMAICLWLVLFILAIDVRGDVKDMLSVIAIFLPVLTVNILAYLKQNKLTLKTH